MRVIATVPIDNSADEFLRAVGCVNSEVLLGLLSHPAAELERTCEDEPLANRLSIAAVAHAATSLPDPYSQPSPRVPKASDLDELLARANGLAERDRRIDIGADELHHHNLTFIVRMHALHEMLMGPLMRGLGRSDLLLRRLLPSVVASGSNPLDALPAAMGGTLEETRAILFAIFSAALREETMNRRLTSVRTWSATRQGERFAELASAFARTVPALRELSAQESRYKFKTPQSLRYGYPALRDFPVVLLSNGDTTVPMPRYAALILSEGIYDALQRYYVGAQGSPLQRFSQVFGELAEDYVELRFTHTLGRDQYAPLKRVKGDLSPDGFHRTGDCVIEVKGRRLPPDVRLTGDIDAVQRFITGEGGIAHGAAQMLREIQRTRQGRGRGLDRHFLDVATPCLITPDGLPGFHLAPVRQWTIDAIVREVTQRWPQLISELSALYRFEWLSFDEFDSFVLASRHSGSPFGFLLRDYRASVSNMKPLDPLTNAFAPHPESWLRSRGLFPTDDSLISEAFHDLTSECQSVLFAA